MLPMEKVQLCSLTEVEMEERIQLALEGLDDDALESYIEQSVSDYGTGRIWGMDATTLEPLGGSELLDTPYSISSFGESASGELYFLHYSSGSGRIYRIEKAN